MRALISTLAFFLITNALAQGGAEYFAALDRNRDGYISRVEALANAEVYKRFQTFDRDKDGLLSQAEFALVMEDNRKRMLQDAAITERVKAALLAERALASRAISVETYEGRVQLSGFVPAPELASRAGRVAAGVAGVRTVHNDITVR